MPCYSFTMEGGDLTGTKTSTPDTPLSLRFPHTADLLLLCLSLGTTSHPLGVSALRILHKISAGLPNTHADLRPQRDPGAPDPALGWRPPFEAREDEAQRRAYDTEQGLHRDVYIRLFGALLDGDLPLFLPPEEDGLWEPSTDGLAAGAARATKMWSAEGLEVVEDRFPGLGRLVAVLSDEGLYAKPDTREGGARTADRSWLAGAIVRLNELHPELGEAFRLAVVELEAHFLGGRRGRREALRRGRGMANPERRPADEAFGNVAAGALKVLQLTAALHLLRHLCAEGRARDLYEAVDALRDQHAAGALIVPGEVIERALSRLFEPHRHLRPIPARRGERFDWRTLRGYEEMIGVWWSGSRAQALRNGGKAARERRELEVASEELRLALEDRARRGKLPAFGVHGTRADHDLLIATLLLGFKDLKPDEVLPDPWKPASCPWKNSRCQRVGRYLLDGALRRRGAHDPGAFETAVGELDRAVAAAHSAARSNDPRLAPLISLLEEKLGDQLAP